MNYILVTYKKKIEELPEVKSYEDNQFYIAKRDLKHYRDIDIKANIWVTDGETARKLDL